MAIFDIFRKKNIQPTVQEERSTSLGGLLFNGLSSFKENKAMQLSAFFCGVNQISNAVASLKIKVVENDVREINNNASRILNLQPNDKWSKFNLYKAIIEHVIVNGAAYLYIQRDDKLNVKALVPIENKFVKPLKQVDGSIKYNVANYGVVDAVNMLDFAMWRDEQWNGVPLIKYAFTTLTSASDTETAANKYYKGGAGLNGVLKASATLTNEQKQQIRDSWNQAFSVNGNGVAVIPAGLDYTPISSNAVESQLNSAREFNVIEIARFLNISPIKLFDLDNVNYSTLEATNIYFIQDTIRPYCEMICAELNLKLVKPSELGIITFVFDYTSALAANKQVEAEYYRTLVANGICTANEVREKLGFAPMSGGDKLMFQISYGTLEDISEGKYIKQTAQEENTKTDNKVGK